VAPVALVGKGLTFDSGGLTLKDGEDMDEMKGDMAGAAAVVGVLAAAAGRQAPVTLVGLLAIAENMPSGRASRPGDVVSGHAGLSVEIVDTDAEGRLALADALSYAARHLSPRLVIDLATLTGAVETTLGRHKAGLFTPDEALAARLLAAAAAEDEGLWRLPLTDGYDAALDSPIADLRNASWDDQAPDHLHAARFLQRFLPEGLAWAHLDIAGTATADEDGPLTAEGRPTGFGIRLLDRLVESLDEE
jgi:leucyl aminopeptidase